MNRATRLPISYHVITGPSQVSRHQGQHTASDQPHFFPLFPPIASLWVQLDSNVPTCSLASFALPGAPKLHSCGTLHTSCFELGSHPFNNSMFNVQPRSVFLSPALPFPPSISWFSSPNRLQFSIAEPVVPREIGRARASRGQCVSK
jgi:hypothetical protein